jgi:hypothetical protein
MRRAPPRLAELAIRLLLVGALLVTAARLLQTTLIRPLLPLYGATVVLLAPQFTLQSLEPVEFAGHTVVPIGWLASGQQGGYEVSLSLTGLLQYPTLALLILLAWPAANLRVLGTRLLLAVPITALLLLTEAPTTIVAELWSVVRNQADPGAICYWMVWSRFLMGGGGLLMAGILGATGVIVAQRLQRAPSSTAFA